MKIILAPDSFKGSLTSAEVCRAMAEGIKKELPQVELISIPMADGGEGTVEAVIFATNGRIMDVLVKDPLGRTIKSFLGLVGDGSTAIIEMAAASGLPLLKENERNPLLASTYGTGQLIKAALDLKVKQIIIGIGGSATNDGGVGMAKALGARFFDATGDTLDEGGGTLYNLAGIDLSDLDRRLQTVNIQVACDVTNPLTGPMGATAIYGPQKGATPEMIEPLDQGLLNLAQVVKNQIGLEINNLPGAGAAGGLGGGLVAFLNAKLVSGVDLVIEATHLRDYLQEANLAFTGEGRIDYQSSFGKTISGVGKAALEFNVPVIAVAGSLGTGYEQIYQNGIVGLTSIISCPMTLDEAMAHSYQLVSAATARSLKLFMAGNRYKCNTI